MGSFPCMRHPVGLHVAFTVEAPTTVYALVRSLPRVDSHVQSQSSTLSEVHATFLALVRLLSCVDSRVILQMARLFKTFGTDGTRVSPLPDEVVHVVFQSNTVTSFTLPCLWPHSCWCERLNPFSVYFTFCILAIFALIHGVKGQRNSSQSRQLAAVYFSIFSLFLWCIKSLVGQSLVVVGA